MKASKVLVTCPKCGHAQHEPSTAYSSVCKKCRQYFRLEELLSAKGPARAGRAGSPEPAPAAARDVRRIRCFQCGADLEVSPSAQSTMCKRCSAHVDLKDHQITCAVSKNFRTKGRLVVEEGGFLFNTETIAGDVLIKGRFLGKLVAERTLEIHRTAEIKGKFEAGRLLIPAGHGFRWAETLALNDAEIAGEVVANVRATGTIVLRPGSRFFGDIEAANLIVENGAVLVGRLKLGPMTPEPGTEARATAKAPAKAPAKAADTAASKAADKVSETASDRVSDRVSDRPAPRVPRPSAARKPRRPEDD